MQIGSSLAMKLHDVELRIHKKEILGCKKQKINQNNVIISVVLVKHNKEKVIAVRIVKLLLMKLAARVDMRVVVQTLP